MESIFEELDLKSTYIQTRLEMELNEHNFDISGHHIISILKNNELVKRYRVVNRYSIQDSYSDKTLFYTNHKPGISFVDPAELHDIYKRYYFKNDKAGDYESGERTVVRAKPAALVFALYPLGDIESLTCIGNGKIVDAFSTSAKLTIKTLSADTAIVLGGSIVKPNINSKNKKFNKWTIWDNTFLRPMKGKNKLNKKELNITFFKTIERIELL